MEDAFATKVYDYVSRIPPGKVTTYGDIAKALGRPTSSRVVGSILKRNPNPFYKVRTNAVKTTHGSAAPVPCHRVVRADLRVGQYSGGAAKKEALLKREGVRVQNGRVAPHHIENPLAQV